MSSFSPELSSPTLQPSVVATDMQQQMGSVQHYSGHWIHAGPGAGKTLGTRLWLERTRRPFAWIQLDAQDNDPLSFLEKLRVALQCLVPLEVQLPTFIPQAGVSLTQHCEYLWETVVLSLRRGSTLVLDDAHLIHDWEQHPVLHPLVKSLDTRLHIVVLSRKKLPESYARDVVNRRIHLIHPQAFVWKTPQLRLWLEKRWGIKRVPETFAQKLLQISQGNAALLALLDIRELYHAGATLPKGSAQPLGLTSLIRSSILDSLAPQDREILRWLADDFGRGDAILENEQGLYLNPELWRFDAWVLEQRFQSTPPEAHAPLLEQLRRGFFGPTSLPLAIRSSIPTLGTLELGPRPLLKWLDRPPEG